MEHLLCLLGSVWPAVVASAVRPVAAFCCGCYTAFLRGVALICWDGRLNYCYTDAMLLQRLSKARSCRPSAFGSNLHASFARMLSTFLYHTNLVKAFAGADVFQACG